MKRALTGLAAAAMVLGTVIPAAFASTTSSSVGGRKAIAVNGSVVSNPFTRVAKDAGTSTSYIGVWYLGQAVKAAGGDYSWDPSTKVFNIVAPGVDASKISVAGGVGTGDTDLTVNGVLVKKVNSFAAQDPAGGKSDVTTFMPLFYLGEIFGNLGGSSWDGNTFSFKKFIEVGAPASVKLSASSTSLVASSAANSTVTGTVVDNHGNTVTSYNGPVNVTLNGSDVTLDKTSYMAVNGVVTINVTNVAHPTVGATDQIIVSLPGVSGSTQSIMLSETAPKATFIDVTGASKAIKEVTSDTEFKLGLQVTDQLHAAIPADTTGFGSATVTVSGPATFKDGSKTQTISTFGTDVLDLTQLANQTGTITLTITSVNGSQAAGNPVSINVIAPGTANSFALTTANPVTSFSADEVAGTAGSNQWTAGTGTHTFGYTVQAQDINGVSVDQTTKPTATVTLNGKATNVITASVGSDSNGAYPVTLSYTDSTNSIPAGTYTLTLTDDSMQPFTQNITVTPGAAAKLLVTPASSLSQVDVTSSAPSTAVTAQVVDQFNNPVAQAGDPITFTNDGGATLTLSGGAGTSTAQTVYTNESGVATITASATQAGSNGDIVVSGTAGQTSLTGAATAAVYELGAQSAAKLAANVTYASGTSYTAGSGAHPTVSVQTLDAAGAPYTSTDKLQYSITGPAGFTAVSDQDVSGAITLNSDIAGNYTVTVKDVSNTNVAPATATVTVVPGAANKVQLFDNNGVVSNEQVAADAQTALTVKVTDSSNNVVAAPSDVTVNLGDTSNGGAFALTPGGAPVTSVTVPAGSNGVQVYYVNSTAGTYALTAGYDQVPTVKVGAFTQSGSAGAYTYSTTVTVTDQLGKAITGLTSTAFAAADGNSTNLTVGSVTAGNTAGTYTVVLDSTSQTALADSGTITVTLANTKAGSGSNTL